MVHIIKYCYDYKYSLQTHASRLEKLVLNTTYPTRHFTSRTPPLDQTITNSICD